jgi:uncharacterized protein (DUF1778 family)
MQAISFYNGMLDNTKDARFEAKLNSKLKDFIQLAAGLQGCDLTAFVLSAAAEKARAVVTEAEMIALNEKDHNAFMKILMNPPKATPQLKELMAMESLNER